MYIINGSHVLLLYLYIVFCILETHNVMANTRITEGLYHPGEVMIGAILSINGLIPNDEKVTFKIKPQRIKSIFVYQEKYQTAYTLLFAIEEINKNLELLPNITLGFHLYESLMNEAETLNVYMKLLTGRDHQIPNYRCKVQGHLIAVVGFASSVLSLVVANTFGMYGYPQISYGATDPLLSDNRKFPNFYHTAPNDNHLHNALTAVLKHFGWTWVGIIYSNVENNENAIQKLKVSIVSGGGCIAFIEKFLSSATFWSEEYIRLSKVISDSSVNVVVFWANLEFTYKLYLLLRKLPMSKKVWIFLTDMTHLLIPTIDNLDLSPFNGMLAIHTTKTDIPGLMNFIWNTTLDGYFFNNFMLLYKTFIYQCELCEGRVLYNTCRHDGMKKKKMMGLETQRESYRIFNAIYVLAYALHELLTSKFWQENYRQGTTPALQNLRPWMLHSFLKKVHFRNTAGEDIYFSHSGDSAPVYDLVNWILNNKRKLLGVTVGKVSSREDPLVNESAIMWPEHFSQVLPRSVCSVSCPAGSRKTMGQRKPACCYDCVPCPRGEFSNHTDMISCWKCLDEQWPNKKKDKCIPKQVTYLSYKEMLGACLASSAIVLSMLSLFTLGIFIHYQNTSVIRSTNRNLSSLLLMSLTLTFCSCLIFIGHPGPITCLTRQTVFAMSFTLSVSSLLAKTILVVLAFQATKPGSQLRRFMGQKLPCSIVSLCTFIQAVICALWLGTCPPTPLQDLHSQPGQIVIACEERLGLFVSLAFIGGLAMGCLAIAFPARTLPNTYNEAKFITFSMLVFFTVWITFIPTYLSTKGKYTVAVEIFAILASGAGVLVSIFLPKCFIIFYMPYNTRITAGKYPRVFTKHDIQRRL